MNSSNLFNLLRSVCQQLKTVYQIEKVIIPSTLKDLIATFQNLMLDESQRAGRQLYVIFDSLDSLDHFTGKYQQNIC
jgi:hypothetical protein